MTMISCGDRMRFYGNAIARCSRHDIKGAWREWRRLAAPRMPRAMGGVSTSQVRVQVLFIPPDWKHPATPRARHHLGRAA